MRRGENGLIFLGEGAYTRWRGVGSLWGESLVEREGKCVESVEGYGPMVCSEI